MSQLWSRNVVGTKLGVSGGFPNPHPFERAVTPRHDALPGPDSLHDGLRRHAQCGNAQVHLLVRTIRRGINTFNDGHTEVTTSQTTTQCSADHTPANNQNVIFVCHSAHPKEYYESEIKKAEDTGSVETMNFNTFRHCEKIAGSLPRHACREIQWPEARILFKATTDHRCHRNL